LSHNTTDSNKKAVLYFDVISPWACLMDHALRVDPLPIFLEYRPVLFAGLLNTFGHKGPAEIESKRIFTYELCTWTGQAMGLPFVMPAVHPFKPLNYLRLIVGLGATPQVVSAVFDQLYTTGCNPDTNEAWQALLERLNITEAKATALIETPAHKEGLKENTLQAAQNGVFGVPTIVVDGKLFWGLDSLPMLRAHLKGDPSLSSTAMTATMKVEFGVKR
jgi:2-hydroxychromene-2-carboxylate isomerase